MRKATHITKKYYHDYTLITTRDAQLHVYAENVSLNIYIFFQMICYRYLSFLLLIFNKMSHFINYLSFTITNIITGYIVSEQKIRFLF